MGEGEGRIREGEGCSVRRRERSVQEGVLRTGGMSRSKVVFRWWECSFRGKG